MRSVHQTNVAVRSYFEVYDAADAAVTGLVDGDFTKLLAKDGANSAVSVTITEIGSGRYVAEFTPTGSGDWHLTVRHATHGPRGWHETFDVTDDCVPKQSLNGLTDGILDRTNAVDSSTIRRVLRLIGSTLGGKNVGTAAAPAYRALDDSKTRVQATAGRATVTLDLT